MNPIGSGSVRWRLPAGAAAVLIGLLAAMVSTKARADINVAGTIDAVQIRANGESIARIFSVLAKTFGVQYKTSIVLDETVSGAYSGSLSEAISSLLNGCGYNYVIRHDHGALEIVVLGRRGVQPSAATRAPAPAPTFAAQWR